MILNDLGMLIVDCQEYHNGKMNHYVSQCHLNSKYLIFNIKEVSE